MLVRMEKVLVAATRRRYDDTVCSAAGALLPDVGGGALVAAVAESNTEGPRFSEAPTNRGRSGKFRGAQKTRAHFGPAGDEDLSSLPIFWD
jgi:hypothetical protein